MAANTVANSEEFDAVVKALEEGKGDEAASITKDHVDQLVDAVDQRDKEKVEESKNYKYRQFQRKGLTLLHYAAMYDNPEMVRILLEHKADPSKEEAAYAKNNPFIYACMFGGEDTVSEFLKHENCKELVNKWNTFMWFPMFYVSERKKPALTKLLLESGADPNKKAERNLKSSVLQFAIKYSSTECVKLLLEKPVDVNYCDDIGQTALHLACANNDLEIVKLLCDEHKADTTIADKTQKTALQVAICKGSDSCAKFLIEKFKLTMKNGFSTLKDAVDRPKMLLNILRRHICEHGQYSVSLDSTSQKLLHEIVESDAYSDEEFTEAALSLGKNCMEYEDDNGRTPMMITAMLNKHSRLEILLDVYIRTLKECMITPLIDGGQFKHLFVDLMAKKDKQGYSAVHFAVMCDGPDVHFEQTVKALSSLRKNRTIKRYLNRVEELENLYPLLVQSEPQKKSGMHLAIERIKPERALVLLRETGGKGVELQDSMGYNVIHCALHHKVQAVIFKQLLDLHLSGANSENIRIALSSKNNEEETPLQMALKVHLPTHAEHLLSINDIAGSEDQTDGGDRIVDPNVQDESGKNALHIAIEHGAPIELIKKLMESGCNPVMTDNEENFPVQVDLQHVKAVLDHERNTNKNRIDYKNLLKAAIKGKREDIIEHLLTMRPGVRVDASILESVIVETENKEYARLLIRYAEDADQLMKELRKPSDSGDVLFHALIKKMPDVAEEALDRSVALQDDDVNYKGTKILLAEDDEDSEDEPKDDLNSFSLKEHGKPATEHVHTSTLGCMVEHEELELLQHPGVNYVLSRKWKTFGFPLYFLQIFAYCFLVIPLSMLVLQPLTFPEDAEDPTRPITTYSLAGILLVVSVLHFLVMLLLLTLPIFRRYYKDEKACKIILAPFPIINNFHHYLQAMVYLFSITFSILTITNTATNGCCVSATWHVGLTTVILGWTYFVHLSSKLPFVGEQAIIFLDIVKTFLKLVLFALLLVLAATVILSTTFHNAEALQSPFITFRRGLVTVTTMITGELDYSSVFGLSYEASNSTGVDDLNMLYPETANLVWILFLIFIPILLSNMLTGLAVGDVIEMQKNAELRKLGHQVKLAGSAEYYFKSCKICCCTERSQGFISKAYELVRKVFSTVVYSDDSEAKEEDDMKEKLLSYKKKRDADIKEIRKRGEFRKDDRIAESIDDVKKVALNCEKRITEFKDAYDSTIKKLTEDAEKLKKELGQLKNIQQVHASAQ